MPTLDLDKIKKSDAPKEVMEVYRRLKRDMIDDADRKIWETQRKANWAAAYPLDLEKEGIWSEDDKKKMTERGQIPVSINDLAKGIQGSSAVVTSKNPGLNFTPIGDNDLYVAELLKRGWDFTLNRNGGPITFFDWVKESKTGGLGVIEAKHDPSKGIYGKIVIEEVDPTFYYFDKRSRRRDHADVSFGKAHQVTKKYALETYEGLAEDDLIFTEIQKDEEGDKPDTKTGQDNYAIPGDQRAKDKDQDDDEVENIWEIEDWELKREKEKWVMIPSREKPGEFDREIYKTVDEIKKAGWTISEDGKTATKIRAPSPAINQGEMSPMAMMTGSPMQPMSLASAPIEAIIWPRIVEKRIQRVIVGKKVIVEEENPLGVDSDGEPILPMATLPHDKTLKGFPTCPTSRAIEISKSRNKRRMQSIYVISKNLDAPLHRQEGTKWVKNPNGEDELMSSKDVQVAPTRILPGTTSAEIMNMEQRDEMALNDEYDLSDVVKGKIPPGQSNIAGRTVLALQDMVGVMSQPFTLAVESGLERLGKTVTSLMLKTWPRTIWERLLEPDEWGTWQPDGEQKMDESGQPIPPQPDEIKQKWTDALDKLTGENAMSVMDFDIKVIAGSTQPTNRMAKQGVAMEMVKAQIYDAEAALDYIDDPKKDAIVKRMQDKAKAQSEPVKLSESFTVDKLMPYLTPNERAQVLEKYGIQADMNAPTPPLPTTGGAQ